MSNLNGNDWTCDQQGRKNASLEFMRLCAEVERLIRSHAATLIEGRSDEVASDIVSRLAHEHGMAPVKFAAGRWVIARL